MQKKHILPGLAALMMGVSACTNLDEKVYSEIPAENFYKNRTEVMAAVLRPFTHANAWAAPTGQVGHWRVNELSADQLAWPQKGRHGFDGGDWIRLHNHAWIANDNNAWNPWRLMFWGMGFCNNTIKDLSAIDFKTIGMTDEDKVAIIAETKALRAWHYLKLMDLYGNIPIVTEVGVPVSPPNATRKEVWEFIEKELKENVDNLPKLAPALVGRVTRAAGYAMLAELYLNAEKWAGTPRWDDCVAACNKILDGSSGSLSGAAPALETDLLKPFDNMNHLSPENLFQITYDYTVGNFRFGWNGDLWHYEQKKLYNANFNGNNGIVVIPTAFDAFSDKDLRKKTWLLIDTARIDVAFRTNFNDSIVKGTEEYAGKPLVFVKEIRRNSEGETGAGGMTRGEENSGARFNKYRPGVQTSNVYWNNDFVLYRLAEIYYNKAEALMRKNGGTATAEVVDLVNTVRKRAFSATDWPTEAYTVAKLTLDEFLAERGREFIFEGKRRTDMIRFGKFTTASWWDHPASGQAKWELFPIPYNQMILNKNLKQNPGYE